MFFFSWESVQRSSWRLIHSEQSTLNGNSWIKTLPQVNLLLNTGFIFYIPLALLFCFSTILKSTYLQPHVLIYIYNRRHTLQISPGDLKMNLEKLVSAVSFWSKLAKVNFPTLPQSLYFDNGNSNNNGNSNLCPNGNCTTLGINGNHLYPQGT